MTRLAQIHELRREANLHINALKLHAALLTEAIENGKVEQAEAQLSHLVKGIHGGHASISKRPFALHIEIVSLGGKS